MIDVSTIAVKDERVIAVKDERAVIVKEALDRDKRKVSLV